MGQYRRTFLLLCLLLSAFIHYGGFSLYKTFFGEREYITVEYISNKALGSELDKKEGDSNKEGTASKDSDLNKTKDLFKSFKEDGHGLCDLTKTYYGFGGVFKVHTVIRKNEEVTDSVIFNFEGVKYLKVDTVKKNGPLDKAGVGPEDYVESFVKDLNLTKDSEAVKVKVITKGLKKVVELKAERICYN